MTAKKKQKQKKILLQRGVSVSSSSSDDDDDDDENAVKDKRREERREKDERKNWKRNVGLDAPIQKERRKRRTLAEFLRLRRDVDEEGGEQEQRFDGRKRRRKYVDVPRGEAESEGQDAEEREDGFGQGD